MTLEDFLEGNLAELSRQHLRRQLRGPEEGLINFSSNDYLGLTRHPRLIEAAREAALRYGNGCGASRLVGGDLKVQQELEESLASFKQTKAVLTFATGFAAATGTIPAIVTKGDVLIMDKLCHACLIDGARLSGATVRVYPHNDLNYLEKLLKRANPDKRTLVVTESVFSMDGDLAPLGEIARLKDRYGAWLMVDEAHATGVFGRNRSGLIEQLGLGGRIEIQMGTMSKALGCSGGYIAGSRMLIDYLINRARSLIYSTAPSPAMTGGALGALRLVMSAEGEQRQKRLWERVHEFAKASDQVASSPILPRVYGEENRALAAATLLQSRGMFAPAIRYPTVARGKARVRLTITANHRSEEISRLVEALVASESI